MEQYFKYTSKQWLETLEECGAPLVGKGEKKESCLLHQTDGISGAIKEHFQTRVEHSLFAHGAPQRNFAWPPWLQDEESIRDIGIPSVWHSAVCQVIWNLRVEKHTKRQCIKGVHSYQNPLNVRKEVTSVEYRVGFETLYTSWWD